jgi:hypothetical protein
MRHNILEENRREDGIILTKFCSNIDKYSVSKKTVFISERNQMSTISSEMTQENYRKG